MGNSVPPATGMVVVTHVHTQQGYQRFTSPQSGVVPPVSSSPSSSPLGIFLKVEPVALGTVQIMTGVVIMLFGIVTGFYVTASLISGIMFWGASIYITAGSLTVAANKKLSECLVKASLGMNIISTITAGIAIFLHFIDFFIINGQSRWGGEMFLRMGITGVMIVLSLLEFIVSICVSAFACKATRSSNTEQVVYVSSQVPPSFPTSHLSAPPLNPSEVPLLPTSMVDPDYQC